MFSRFHFFFSSSASEGQSASRRRALLNWTPFQPKPKPTFSPPSRTAAAAQKCSSEMLAFLMRNSSSDVGGQRLPKTTGERAERLKARKRSELLFLERTSGRHPAVNWSAIRRERSVGREPRTRIEFFASSGTHNNRKKKYVNIANNANKSRERAHPESAARG